MNAEEPNDKQAAADLEMLRAHAEQLSEHWDTVQIFATRHDPASNNGTIRAEYGLGNSAARFGQVRESIILHETRIAVSVGRGPA